VATSGVGQDAAVVGRPDAKQIDFQTHQFGREGAAKEATPAQNARADNQIRLIHPPIIDTESLLTSTH
jgi:hypothetical protein